jgi:hypothetical protein
MFILFTIILFYHVYHYAGLVLPSLDMSTDSFGTPENFSGIFPANFLTKNSEATTGPKGRRVRDHEVVSTWEPRSGS